ncbi:hypothetical protein ACQKIE_16230 [Luteibacter sp. NPDC031894]|uniref:hypothetical protein n=1 Tax=Luteibacter sp. NPDC031894 TaxID=3390572 RepID=UPI003D050891
MNAGMPPMAHTPGPWHVVECASPDCWCALIEADVEDVDGDKTIISSGSLRKHNALVVAQAPRLLELCIKFNNLYGHLWDVVDPGGYGMLSPESVAKYDELHREMNRAIADATGRDAWVSLDEDNNA